MALSIDDVRKIASLARLRFTPDEEAAYAGQLGKIVDYIDQLQRVDPGREAEAAAGGTAAADPASTAAIATPAAPEAPDVILPCLPREVFLANAPAALDGFLVVPEVKAGAGDDGLH
jgi:aspartyl-tRNA(Asn)/glutamyl-tRNA(Gln) amidotransferase subunit C